MAWGRSNQSPIMVALVSPHKTSICLTWPLLLSVCLLPSLIIKPLGHPILLSIKLSSKQSLGSVDHRDRVAIKLERKPWLQLCFSPMPMKVERKDPLGHIFTKPDRTQPWLIPGLMQRSTTPSLPWPQPISRVHNPTPLATMINDFPSITHPLEATEKPGLWHQLTCDSRLGTISSTNKPLLSWLQTPVHFWWGSDACRQVDSFSPQHAGGK